MISFSTQEKIETIEAARKALKVLHESNTGIAHGVKGIKKLKGFNKKDMFKKAEKDALFFEHIYQSVISSDNANVKNAYDKLITEAMILTGQILQEADVAPRTVSAVIDYEVLSEESMLKHYKRSFNMILESKFNKPNIESKLLFENIGDGCQAQPILAPGIKGLMIKCAQNGILDQNDPEAVAKYLSAENAVSSAISNVFIPNRIFNHIQNFQNDLPEGYSDIFGNGFNDKIGMFNNVVNKIAAVIAPFIFMRALQTAGSNVPFNPAQVAGLGLETPNNEEPVPPANGE